MISIHVNVIILLYYHINMQYFNSDSGKLMMTVLYNYQLLAYESAVGSGGCDHVQVTV